LAAEKGIAGPGHQRPVEIRASGVLGLVRRIDQEREGENIEMVIDMLQVLAKRLPKRPIAGRD